MFTAQSAITTTTKPASRRAGIRHCPAMLVTTRSYYFLYLPTLIFSLVSADLYRYRRAKAYDCAKERGQANRHN